MCQFSLLGIIREAGRIGKEGPASMRASKTGYISMHIFGVPYVTCDLRHARGLHAIALDGKDVGVEAEEG